MNATNSEFSRQKLKLISDAKAAGYSARESQGRVVLKQGKRSVTVWERGGSTRNDVALSLASGMSLAVVREYLCLDGKHGR